MKEDMEPYYAVIFTSELSKNTAGYAEMAQRMEDLAHQEKDFMYMDSARDTVGITISYWKSLEGVRKWKENTAHLIAQKMGKEVWYSKYSVRIAKVEREYHFTQKGQEKAD